MSENSNDMPFLGHLEEMRSRIMKSVIAIGSVAILVFIGKDWFVEELVFGPTKEDFATFKFWCSMSHRLGMGDKLCVDEIKYSLQSTTMSGAFMAHLLVSIIGGIVIAFPFVFHQIWQFVKPGLRKNEASAVRGITAYTSLLFFTGVLFGYYVILPLSLQFLGGYEFGEVKVDSNIGSYMKLFASICLATGLIFQLPILVYFLSKLGLVTPQILRKYRKHALVVVLILAAIITPPDLTSQILVAIPVMILYELSIFVSRRTIKKAMEAEEQ